MKHVQASVAEYERIKIRQRTKRGKRDKARAGNLFHNRVPPFGYREALDGERRTLELVPEEAAVVREIFDLYLNGDGMGVNAIAAPLANECVPTVGDTRRTMRANTIAARYGWHTSTVSRMLRSSVYRGKWTYAKNDGDPIEIEVSSDCL